MKTFDEKYVFLLNKNGNFPCQRWCEWLGLPGTMVAHPIIAAITGTLLGPLLSQRQDGTGLYGG